MSRIIGDRKEKSALDEMEEVARARNKDVAEEERMEALRKAKEALSGKAPLEEKSAEFVRSKEIMVPVLDYLKPLAIQTYGTALIAALAIESNITCHKEFAKELIEYLTIANPEADGLYLVGGKSKEYNKLMTYTNSHAAIALLSAGEKDKAEAIVKAIEKRLKGMDYYLYMKGQAYATTADQASMASAYILLGNVERGKKILENVEHFMHKTGELYNYGRGNDNELLTELTTKASVSMAIAYSLLGSKDKSEKIVEAVEKEIGRDKGLYKLSTTEISTSIFDSVLMATAYALLDGGKII